MPPVPEPVAAIYCRISSDPTGRRAGVTRQQEECTALCRSRGWRVGPVYTDNDISAYSGVKRPDYEALQAAIKQGTVTRIVSWHPDRLHRSPRELEDFIDLLQESGAQVATVQTGDWDLSTASGQLHARMLGAVARYESAHKSERVLSALDARARAGQPVGGARRYGYEPDGLTIRPAEQAVVADAARRILAGDPLRAITRHLTDNNSPTVTGTAWTPTALRQILTGPRTAGLRQHQGQIIGPAAWPPLLDIDTWHAVRAILTDPHRRQAPSTARVHLLSNLVTCAPCGAGLLPHHTSRAVNYSCRDCGKVSMRKTLLERYVVNTLIGWWDVGNVQPVTVEPAPEAQQLALDIAAVRTRIEQLPSEFADDDTATVDVIRATVARLTVRLTELEERQAQAQRRTVLSGWAPGRLREQWDEASLERQRALLAVCFPTITVAPATRRGPTFDPDRIVISP